MAGLEAIDQLAVSGAEGLAAALEGLGAGVAARAAVFDADGAGNQAVGGLTGFVEADALGAWGLLLAGVAEEVGGAAGLAVGGRVDLALAGGGVAGLAQVAVELGGAAAVGLALTRGAAGLASEAVVVGGALVVSAGRRFWMHTPISLHWLRLFPTLKQWTSAVHHRSGR